MKKIKVKYYLSVPEETSVDDVEEWIKFKLHFSGTMKNSNPLSSADGEFDVKFESIQIDD